MSRLRMLVALCLAGTLVFGLAPTAFADEAASGYRNCGTHNVKVHSQAQWTVRHYLNGSLIGHWQNSTVLVRRTSTAAATSGNWVVTSTTYIHSASSSCTNML